MPVSSVSSRFDIESISGSWHAEWRKMVLTQCCPVSPSVCNSAKIFSPVSMPSLVPCPLFMLLGDYFRTLYINALPCHLKKRRLSYVLSFIKVKKNSYMQLHFSTLVKENSLVKKKHLANICQKHVNGMEVFSVKEWKFLTSNFSIIFGIRLVLCCRYGNKQFDSYME